MSQSLKRGFVLLATFVAAASPVFGQASFRGIGRTQRGTEPPTSWASLLSDDGSTLVGVEDMGPDLFVWSETAGVEHFGGLPQFYYDRLLVSETGDILIGCGGWNNLVWTRPQRQSPWTAQTIAALSPQGVYAVGWSDCSGTGSCPSVPYRASDGLFERFCSPVPPPTLSNCCNWEYWICSMDIWPQFVADDGTMYAQGDPNTVLQVAPHADPIAIPFGQLIRVMNDGSLLGRLNGVVLRRYPTGEIEAVPNPDETNCSGLISQGRYVSNPSLGTFGLRTTVRAQGVEVDALSAILSQTQAVRGWRITEVVGVSCDSLCYGGTGINPFGEFEAWHVRLDHPINPSEVIEVCPADYDADHDLDSDDIVLFFEKWDSGNRLGDINASWSNDSDDIVAFFNLWDSGC